VRPGKGGLRCSGGEREATSEKTIMKKLLWLAVICASLTAKCMAQTNLISEAGRLEEQGRFKEAAALLTQAIKSQKHSGAETATLAFDLDRLKRIKEDYSLTRGALYDALKESVRDLTPAEYDRWINSGWFDSREIDGTLYFFNSSVSNLYFRHPGLTARRLKAKDPTEKERLTIQTVEAITEAARAEHTPYVLPRKFHVKMSVTADADAAPDSQIIRAWLPIPRRYPFQYDFKLLSSSCPPKAIADEDSPIRSIYFEQAAQAKKPTRYEIEYEFTTRGVHFELNPGEVRACDPNDPALKPYLAEAPHVVFTPEMKALSASIVGQETNPMSKAKKIYDWLSDHLQYSYALEYSTIPNISDYSRVKCYGDCGQQALLFITLCRLNGVPARWQSGWHLLPRETTNHDWAEMYLAPYGWMPVDPYMGNFAMRYVRTLTPGQKLKIRDFYFGGLDQYRMAANGDHSQPLSPVKQSFRSDDVDFQRGELEAGGTNLYFDAFSYHLERQEITTSQ
jgi:transglutaminase-like putative cysteine protease